MKDRQGFYQGKLDLALRQLSETLNRLPHKVELASVPASARDDLAEILYDLIGHCHAARYGIHMYNFYEQLDRPRPAPSSPTTIEDLA